MSKASTAGGMSMRQVHMTVAALGQGEEGGEGKESIPIKVRVYASSSERERRKGGREGGRTKVVASSRKRRSTFLFIFINLCRSVFDRTACAGVSSCVSCLPLGLSVL